MSLIEFFERLGGSLHVSDSCFLLALIYVDRLTEANPSLELHPRNIHKIVVACVTLSIKYLEDYRPCKGDFLCQVLGIQSKELARLELELLNLIHYDLHVTKET